MQTPLDFGEYDINEILRRRGRENWAALDKLRWRYPDLKMSRTSYSEVLFSMGRVGSNYTNSTSETSLTGQTSGGAWAAPREWWQQGRTIHFVANGAVSTAASTPGNLTLNLRWGSTSGTIMIGTGALALATSQTTKTFTFEGWIECNAIGTSGTVKAFGQYINGALSTATMQSLPASAVAAVTIDTTIANDITFSALTSAASASNIVTLHQFFLEAWN